MGELKTILWKKTFSYEGLISVSGVYHAASDWLEEQMYHPYEKSHMEQTFEDGKEIVIEIFGSKELSDYAKIRWETTIKFTKLQEMVVDKDNQKVRMHKGKVVFSSDVFLETDYENSWEQKAFLYFLRTVIDRFVFKSYINRAVGRVRSQYLSFEDKVKSYLNMERFH